MAVALHNIMVATDFSEASQPATTYALGLARALGAALYLIHVVPEEDMRLLTGISQHLQSALSATTLTDVLYAEAEKHMTQLIQEAHASDIVRESLVVTGPPAETILSWATAKQVHLIVLGTHGRSGLSHFLMGSVAEQVLRQAPGAVLVVPPKQQGIAS
ncbi:MAG: universal stress protein [Candidatus Tectimicrobiota bacterium]